MKSIYKNLAYLFTFSFIIAFVSCSNDDSGQDGMEKDKTLNFLIKVSSTEDALVKDGDGTFMSLAVFIFNKDDGYCEYAELIPDFKPEAVSEYFRGVNVSSKTKVIYAIANYNDLGKFFSQQITPTISMAQLDALTVQNFNFPPNSLLMIGKKEVEIDTEFVTAEIPMERLVARLDIYMFKNQKLANDVVTVRSIQLVNQVLNSNVAYGNKTMVTPYAIQNVNGTIDANPVLGLMPSDLSGIIPANAHTSFYTNQNTATGSTPNDAITSYLLITATIGSGSYTYKAYFTDEGRRENRYNLMRNTVYRVMAMLDKPDNDLILNITPYPWTISASEIGHAVNDSDYTFDIYTTGDTNSQEGIVNYPHANGTGQGVNETSFASYNFSLTAPKGAIWTATLTNGLDFQFGTEGSSSDHLAVSKGIARDNAYEIRVGATKPWDGFAKTTYMYITVDGVKLKINPLQGNNTRRFPGNNDTDILITQQEYQ